MTDYDLGKVVGDAGADGNGVASVTLISTSGKVKTYRMTFTDGTYVDYQVTDGSDASVTIVASWNSTTSNSKVPSEKLTKNSLDSKIDKSQTAGLVKNDGTIDTNTYLTSSSASSTYQPLLVSGTNIKTVNNNSLLGSGNITIESGSNVDIVTDWEQTLSDAKVPSEKLTKNSLDNKVDKETGKGLFSGNYNDLSNKPSIPSSSSDLSDGSDLIKKSNTTGLIKNDGTIDSTSYSTFSGSYNDLTNKPTIPTASTSTPSADTTSGSYGSGTSYARSNHSHPKSSLYAESSHTHTVSNITDFPSIPSSSSDLSDGSDLVKKSSTTGLLKNDGSVMTGGTGSSNYAIGNHTHSGYVSTSDIADNLTTNDSTKVLSAKQGKALNDLIGQAIAYINQ